MKQPYTHRIEAMPGMELLKDCECYKPRLGFTCKAKDVGLDSYVECMETYSCTCPFSVSYAHSYFCKSPARVYIAKKSEK
jgi:hypothetical protein